MIFYLTNEGYDKEGNKLCLNDVGRHLDIELIQRNGLSQDYF